MKELKTILSTITFIRQNSIFEYLNLYHLPNENGLEHAEWVRGSIKKKYPIYRQKIELWEKVHGLPVITGSFPYREHQKA